MTKPPMTLTPANDNRPVSFDAMLMDYLPLIRRIAKRLERRPGEREDLVQATVEWALANWENLRFPKGMARWLYLNMRNINQSVYTHRNRIAEDVDGKYAATLSVAPTQELHVYAKEVLGRLKPKDQAVMSLVANGWNSPEVAAHLGVTRQAVSLRIIQSRANLARVA